MSRKIKQDNPKIDYRCKANKTISNHEGLTNKKYSIVSSDYFGMDIKLVIKE